MSKQVWKGSVLLGPIPPVLVSCGTLEHPNVFTVAWAGIINTHPPRLSISVRPSRYSHELISKSGEFVVNLPTQSLAKAVDWCGVKSGRTEDKFKVMNLTALPANQVSAPLVGESPVHLECRVFQTIPLGTHDLLLADILAVQVEESLLDEKGRLCLEKANLLAYAHGQYYGLGDQLGTFGWSVKKAEPGKGKNPKDKAIRGGKQNSTTAQKPDEIPTQHKEAHSTNLDSSTSSSSSRKADSFKDKKTTHKHKKPGHPGKKNSFSSRNKKPKGKRPTRG